MDWKPPNWRNLPRGPRHHLTGTPEHNSWHSMLFRCRNSKHKSFPRYGGRGIRVCRAWLSFVVFLADMGPRPTGTTLDRIDGDGHYSCGKCDECTVNSWPANCRWATSRQQLESKGIGPLVPATVIIFLTPRGPNNFQTQDRTGVIWFDGGRFVAKVHDEIVGIAANASDAQELLARRRAKRETA